MTTAPALPRTDASRWTPMSIVLLTVGFWALGVSLVMSGWLGAAALPMMLGSVRVAVFISLIGALAVIPRQPATTAAWSRRAAIAAIAGSVVEFLVLQARSLEALGFVVGPVALVQAAAFVVCALLAARCASALATGAVRGRTLGVIALAALLVVAGAQALALPVQWFEVYFTIWTPAEDPSPAEKQRFLVTAAVATGSALAALVLALVLRRRGLGWLSAGVLLVAVITAALFPVPRDLYEPPPAAEDTYPDPPVCFGTSGDCPGG